MLTDIVDIVLSRRPFDGAAHQCVSLGGIVKLCSGLGNEPVVLEKIDPVLDRVTKMPGIANLGIILRIAFVMADSAEMAKKFTGRNGCFFLRKRRTVFLQGRVKIELALLPEQEGRRCGDGL